MTRFFCILIVTFAGISAAAESVVPTRTIRANTMIKAQDLTMKSISITGTFTDPINLVGQESRVALYAGRPIRIIDVGPPAIIERNQIVSLVFRQGGLMISAEGRALARGGAGERIRVMNLASRTTVFGLIRADGTIQVQ